MTKKNVPHATGGEKKPPEATDHVAPEPTGGLPSFAEVAWRGLQAACGARYGKDPEGELLNSQLDRAAREAAADRQLRELKKKMKKD